MPSFNSYLQLFAQGSSQVSSAVAAEVLIPSTRSKTDPVRLVGIPVLVYARDTGSILAFPAVGYSLTDRPLLGGHLLNTPDAISYSLTHIRLYR